MEPLPKKSYSAYELADMKLPGFPHTAKGWYQFVTREKWPSVEAVASGRGRKGGVRMEFYPTPEVIELIEKLQSSDDKNEYRPRDPANEPPKPVAKQMPVDLYIDNYVEVRAAAGHGQLTPTDQLILQLKVNAADWRRYIGLDHKHVKLITVHGDSMKPTLSHGDQVMVDTACSSFIDDAIYCIQQGENLRFKRIKLNLDGSIVVKSDNEKEGFPPEIYSADEASHFRVIGRVIPLKFGWFEI